MEVPEVVFLGEAYLILENGTVFKGRSFGYDGEAIGELVFSTGMTGYLETLSDPAYLGQIVLQTFPLIGNYGVIPQDFGPGPVHMKAYIVRQWCQEPSNFRSEGNLDSFLREQGTPGICEIDTRALTRLLRENGVMNAMVSKSPELSGDGWAELRGYRVTGAVGVASGKWKVENGKCRDGDADYGKRKVALWDFGCAPAIAERLRELGCDLMMIGCGTSADDILARNPDGIVLSGGPGDPAENTHIIGEIRKLSGSGIPILAVGLGHQMLALAFGAKTLKLRFGHRGANQPVRDLRTGRSFVTTQNHGYAVDKSTLPDCAAVSYENLSDGTCEGIEYSGIPALSIQFEPTEEMLDRFIGAM